MRYTVIVLKPFSNETESIDLGELERAQIQVSETGALIIVDNGQAVAAFAPDRWVQIIPSDKTK